MNISIIIISLLVSISLFMTFMIIEMRNRIKRLKLKLINYNELASENIKLKFELDNEKKIINDKIRTLESAEKIFSDKFSNLSVEALAKNSQSFLSLAKASFETLQTSAQNQIVNGTKAVSDLVTPIQKTLTDVEAKIQNLEKERISAYQSIHEQVKSLISSQNELKSETQKLSSALKVPNIRGRWGEMQLRRVVEISGMINHCDFEEQVTCSNECIVRPDMIIKLPGAKNIIVDAKTPLSSYISAIEATTEDERKTFLKNHAKQIRNHCQLLKNKNYIGKFEDSTDFIVMFLPGEVFFSAALEQDPGLIEFAMEKRIVIATPTTLLALLHAVSMGWKNDVLSENAKHIAKIGRELYKRLADMSEHIFKLEKNILSTVNSYNSFSACMEKRVLSAARKFTELEFEKEIPDLHQINIENKVSVNCPPSAE